MHKHSHTNHNTPPKVFTDVPKCLPAETAALLVSPCFFCSLAGHLMKIDSINWHNKANHYINSYNKQSADIAWHCMQFPSIVVNLTKLDDCRFSRLKFLKEKINCFVVYIMLCRNVRWSESCPIKKMSKIKPDGDLFVSYIMSVIRTLFIYGFFICSLVYISLHKCV